MNVHQRNGVSLAEYAVHVQSQIDFLAGYREDHTALTVTVGAVRPYWEHSVSVDAAASDLAR